LEFRGQSFPINIAALTVKSATVLQLQPLSILRQRHRQDFVDEFAPVLDRGNPDAVYAHVQAVAAAQKQLWKVRWDNHYKEVYWRVVLNGLATGERLHQQQCRCVCGSLPSGQPPGRRHHFWSCPVAQSVVQVVQQQLAAGWCRGVLQPHHVLCMEPTQGVATQFTLHKGVWRVACLAAVNAMDLGRRAACQISVQEKRDRATAAAAQLAAAPARGQRLITDMFHPAPLTPSQLQHQQQVRQHQQLQQHQQQQQQQEVHKKLLQRS
jgi:hypothetical protein